MRIAIDARELHARATGVGRYLMRILDAWQHIPAAHSHEFVLCSTQTAGVTWHWDGLRTTMVLASGSGTKWEQFTLPRVLRKERVDLLWAPAYTGPIVSTVPMVLTIHDVSFGAHPEWFSSRVGFRRRLVTRLAARRAARILTVSDFSKEEIVRHLHVDENKVEVIYSGIGAGPTAIARRSTEPLVLYVGSIFSRRHVPELIEGFGRLAERRRDARLEIVGDNRTYPPIDVDALVATSGASSQIHVASYLADAELSVLYAQAGAFVFLSDYEGFGFTPLEALSAGVPIVVLDTPVAREIYGPAAEYVSSPDPALIEQALERVLFDEGVRARLIESARTILPRYSWSECAHRTLQALVTTK
jgi:glycosyltransferase involved in cell wall biosynthesis